MEKQDGKFFFFRNDLEYFSVTLIENNNLKELVKVKDNIIQEQFDQLKDKDLIIAELLEAKKSLEDKISIQDSRITRLEDFTGLLENQLAESNKQKEVYDKLVKELESKNLWSKIGDRAVIGTLLIVLVLSQL